MMSNPSCLISAEPAVEEATKPAKLLFTIRGKLRIDLAQSHRFLGFKFILSSNYPNTPPMAFLDEPENPMLLEYIDYLGKGNRIMFNYLHDWKMKYI